MDRPDTLIPESLPDWRVLLDEGRSAGESVIRQTTKANTSNRVTSQRKWADHCLARHQFRTQMNIGLSTWPMTEAALTEVCNVFESEGLRPPDAYQLILERRMGLPAKERANAPQETGPVLWTDADWNALGQSAAIQPQAPTVWNTGELRKCPERFVGRARHHGQLRQLRAALPVLRRRGCAGKQCVESLGRGSTSRRARCGRLLSRGWPLRRFW